MHAEADEPEVWRPVVGWEGIYEVSSLGRVRRILAAMGTSEGRVKKLTMLGGYPALVMTRSGRTKAAKVHWLVAQAFLGPRPHGMQIDHIDGDKANARATNLEYVTPSENVRRSWALPGSGALRRRALSPYFRKGGRQGTGCG